MISTCEKHGPYEEKTVTYGDRVMKMGCPGCSIEREALQIKFEQDQEISQKKIRAEQWVRESGMPARYEKTTIENSDLPTIDKFGHEPVYSYATNFDETKEAGRCMVFSGEPGTGKTHIACAIANYVMRNFYGPVIYANMIDVFREIKCSYGRSSKVSEVDIIKKYVAPCLLILDEIGVQYGTPNEAIITHDIINKRYESVKPTILISNLSGDEFKSLLGDRVLRRVKQDGGIHAIFKAGGGKQ